MRYLALLLTFFALTVQADELAGRWLGGFRIGGVTTYANVSIKVENGAVTGALRKQPSDERIELASIESTLPHAAFTADDWKFDGNVHGNEMSGSVNGGTFHFIRAADMKPDAFDAFRGDYVRDGKLFILTRSLFNLYYLDASTGHTGHLVPIDATTFVNGPAMDLFYPIETRVQLAGPGAIRVNGKRYTRIRPYDEQEVTFEGADGVKLSGTLKIPRNHQKSRTGIVLLHGSGTSSRYGINGFIEITADHFARRGFITLTYDKRGTGKSTGTAEDIHLDLDAKAAIALLRKRPEVDPKHIGIWGISQGGILAPQVAKLTDVAFLINTSGALTDDETAEIAGVAGRMRADGFPEAEVQEAVRIQKMKYRFAKHAEGWDEYLAAVEAAKSKEWIHDPYVGEPPTTQDAPAWLFWRGLRNPADFWTEYHRPVLLILGEHDVFLPQEETLKPFLDAMKKAGNTRYETHVLAHASHGMMSSQTGGPKEHPFENRYVAGYFELMTNWLRRVKP